MNTSVRAMMIFLSHNVYLDHESGFFLSDGLIDQEVALREYGGIFLNISLKRFM